MQKFYRSFKIFGLGFLSYKSLSQLQKIESDVFEFFSDMVQRNGGNIKDIKSQIGQDVLVLHCLNWKKNGYFLEFGAADGINLSNTYLLERDFGWSGILAEPAKVWHKDLKANRTSGVNQARLLTLQLPPRLSTQQFLALSRAMVMPPREIMVKPILSTQSH